jgi:hypothetical protein
MSYMDVFVLQLGIVSFIIYLSDCANSVTRSAAVDLKRKTKELNWITGS